MRNTRYFVEVCVESDGELGDITVGRRASFDMIEEAQEYALNEGKKLDANAIPQLLETVRNDLVDHSGWAKTEVVIEAKGVQWRVGRRKLTEAEMEAKYAQRPPALPLVTETIPGAVLAMASQESK